MRLDHLLSKETGIITTVDDSEVEIEKKESRQKRVVKQSQVQKLVVRFSLPERTMKSEEKKEIREAGKDPGTESTEVRGCSSVGRAPALQAGGQGFESLHLHQRTEKRAHSSGG